MLPTLSDQTRLGESYFFFFSMLVHLKVAGFESDFAPVCTALVSIFNISHSHPLQLLSAEACKGTCLRIFPLGTPSHALTCSSSGHYLTRFRLLTLFKQRKQSLGGSRLWEVKMTVTWNPKSKPASSCLVPGVRIPKSF